MYLRFYLQAGSRFLLWLIACAALALLAIQPDMIGYAAGLDNNIAWDEVLHDSRDPLYRNPGGAAAINTDVTLRLRTAANDLTAVQIRVYHTKPDGQSFVSMTKVATEGAYDWWAGTVNTGLIPSIIYYRFLLTDGTDTDYYEDDDRFWGGTGQMYDDSLDRSWALTVYDPAFSTPDWVKNAVFYQVFIDRFKDGNPANNQPAGEFFYGEQTSIVRSNATDWNTPVCDPRNGASACPGVYSQNFYGGDLEGVIDKLDYLQDLGVTALYLNPIFESPSNHKYDTSDFSVIDDNFGSLADFTELVSQADARGMKIVLDGVFNHASSMGPYFDRYNQYATVGACEDVGSIYTPMFQFFEDTVSPTCSDDRDYPYWFGTYSSLAVLNNGQQMARDAVWGDGIVHPSGLDVAVGKYWIEQGAAGWRLDVSPEIDHGMFSLGNNYWENFRAEVHSVDPEAYIVGEQWGMAVDWTSGAVEGSVAHPTGNPGEWDATMNYQQSGALLSFWRDTALNADNDFNAGSHAGLLTQLEPSQFVERYLNIKERYSPEAFAAMMNLLGSHDTQRALWLLDHGHPSNPASGTVYPASASHDWSDALQRLHGVALMQFTLPGAPQIYYGDEIGLVAPSTFDGGIWQDDPYNRIAYPWLDEAGTPYYTHLTSSTTQEANYDYYAALANTRAAHPALRTGDIAFLLADDATNRLAYLRQTADASDSVIVLVNRDSANPNAFTVDLTGKVAIGAQFTDLFTGGSYTVIDDGGTAKLTVAFVGANRGMVLTQINAVAMRPAAPTGLSAVDNGLNIDLSWTASGAESYNVYRSLVSGGGYSLISTTTGSTFTDTTPVVTVAYYYIVKGQNANLLESEASNEAGAQTQYNMSGAYRNVQYPSSLVHTISTETGTDPVYGQIYIGGVTDVLSMPANGLRAQIGYGPLLSDPTVDATGWTWYEMTPNTLYDFSQNNDEFYGRLQPVAVGSYLFTVRYSGNNGGVWHYATDFNNSAPNPELCPDSGNFAACSLIVNSSGDSAAPTAPTLEKDYDTVTEIGLSWSGASDDTAIGKYRIYRSEGGNPFVLLQELDDLVVTYVDESISSGSSYDYVVTAVDTSYNESANSNTVTGLAENTMVDVTFTVTVPDFTPSDAVVQAIGGASALTNWGDGVSLTATANPFEYEITLSFPETSTFEYKYRRDSTWDKVEKVGNGYDEVNNRPYTVGYAEDGPYEILDTIQNWRDVLVTAFSPAHDSYSAVTNIVATFNKTVNTSANFTVLDSAANPVTGTFSVNNAFPPTITFTPGTPFMIGESYSVNVAGVGAEGDGQQFNNYSATFTVKGTVNVTFNVSIPGFTPATDTIYLSGDTAALGNDDPLNGLALTYDVPNNVWTGTLALDVRDDVTVFAHRGSADTVETDGLTGVTPTTHLVDVENEGGGAMTVALTVENWIDPLVVSVTPADLSVDVPVESTVSVVYSKDVKPDTVFVLSDSVGTPVAGSYATVADTVTFTPAAPLAYSTLYRVSADTAVGVDDVVQTAGFASNFTTLAEEIPSVELVDNGGFEDTDMRALPPWKRLDSSGDKIVCNGAVAAHSGVCLFRFKGGPNEMAKLNQKLDISGVSFAAGDTLNLSTWANAAAQTNLRLWLVIKFSDSPKVKVTHRIMPTTDYELVNVPAYTLTSANVTSIKVEFRNKSNKGRVLVDDVSLLLTPGNGRQMGEFTAPLPPPDAPSGWRHN